jgi:anhydro-N-acetylmuramic acid kinase
MGGISNFTFLPSDGDGSKILSTDVGPGNTLIDALCRKHFDMPFDKDGQVAARGKVHEPLLKAMLGNKFFEESFPKTCGPELFNLGFIQSAMSRTEISGVKHDDLVATVTKLTSESIINALRPYSKFKPTIYVSGGGAHNPVIIKSLKATLKYPLKTTADLGIDADAKEAVLFAVLANETLSDSFVKIGSAPGVTMGKISLPW